MGYELVLYVVCLILACISASLHLVVPTAIAAATCIWLFIRVQ